QHVGEPGAAEGVAVLVGQVVADAEGHGREQAGPPRLEAGADAARQALPRAVAGAGGPDLGDEELGRDAATRQVGAVADAAPVALAGSALRGPDELELARGRRVAGHH